MKIPNAAFTYRETASLGASPVGVVILLYDRLAQDIHAAIAAMKSADVEARSSSINHGLLILQQLQGSLDFAAGGAAARQLDVFYSHIRGKLLEAQIRQSPEMLLALAQAQAIAQVRQSWAEVERSSAANGEHPVPTSQAAPTPPEPEPVALSWGA
jgi:flagellar secretion chaperone FliS